MTTAPLPQRMGELALPGALVGALAGCFAGLLAVFGGQPPGWAAVTMVTLAVPLALLGAGHSLLLATGTLRPGTFAPAALFWFLGFPLARMLHELTAHWILAGRPGLPDDPLAFLAFQAMVSVGFAIGFMWLHERIMPRWLLRIRGHNPAADALLAHYLNLAEQVQEERERKRARRAKGRTRSNQRVAKQN
jgi:hypothetical protein